VPSLASIACPAGGNKVGGGRGVSAGRSSGLAAVQGPVSADVAGTSKNLTDRKEARILAHGLLRPRVPFPASVHPPSEANQIEAGACAHSSSGTFENECAARGNGSKLSSGWSASQGWWGAVVPSSLASEEPGAPPVKV